MRDRAELWYNLFLSDGKLIGCPGTVLIILFTRQFYGVLLLYRVHGISSMTGIAWSNERLAVL